MKAIRQIPYALRVVTFVVCLATGVTVAVMLRSISDHHALFMELQSSGIQLSFDSPRIVEVCGLDKYFGTVRSIDAGYTPIGDDVLQLATSCHSLRWLRLEFTNVSDKGMEKLCDCDKLEYLDIAHTRISDAGLASIGRMPRLSHLSVIGTGISDRGLYELRNCQSLKSICVSPCWRKIDKSEFTLSWFGVEKLREALPGLEVSFEAN